MNKVLASATTNIGLEYEKYIQAIIDHKYEIVFTHDTIPFKEYFRLGVVETMDDLRKRYLSYKNGMICDRGFDLIGKKDDQNYDVIQCKKYSRNIGPDDLGGFISLLYVCKERRMEDEQFADIHGVVYTSLGYTPPLLETFKNRKSITFVVQPFDDLNSTYCSNLSIQNYEWRDYQKKAIDEFEHWINVGQKRINLTLPCATGKGNLSFEFIEIFWRKIGVETVFYFAPYKSNVSDLAHRASTLFGLNVEILRIHSFDSKSKIKITNEKQQIEEFLNQNNQRKICFVCFDSADKILPHIKQNSFVIFDEFHDLSKQDLTSSTSSISKMLTVGQCYFLFMSATPRWMDEKIVDYGKNIQTITWKSAIQKKYINDFKIYLPILSEISRQPKVEIDEKSIHQVERISNLQMNFLIFGLMYTGKRKTIIFCTDKSEIKEIRKALDLEIPKYTTLNDFWISEITLETKNRKTVLETFQKENRRSILFSIKILDQCIDIPECDSIFFSSLTNNKIRNVQRIARSLRIYKGKTKSAIFCWATQDEEILDFLESLKEYNLNVEENISVISLGLDKLEKERKLKERIDKEKWKARLEHISEFKINSKEKSLYYEFVSLREKIQSLNFKHKREYFQYAKSNGYPFDPYLKYKTFWVGWYNFLGIDIRSYPQDIDQWRKRCKELKITNYEEYQIGSRNNSTLPIMPEELYPLFTNFEEEL
jgi:superfamily II DNA or RNA helicase